MPDPPLEAAWCVSEPPKPAQAEGTVERREWFIRRRPTPRGKKGKYTGRFAHGILLWGIRTRIKRRRGGSRLKCATLGNLIKNGKGSTGQQHSHKGTKFPAATLNVIKGRDGERRRKGVARAGVKSR